MDLQLIRKILMERTDREGFPTQQEVANFLARYYPEEKAEDKLFHDHWGLFSNDPNGVVKKILLCTTPTQQLVKFCKDNQYDLLISHHDFLFHVAGVPQIIYHSAMDESEKGHNKYFVRKMGLKNRRQLHKVVVGGDMHKPMTLDEFKAKLISAGFEINGLVWESPQADNKIESVWYCSGMGGMLLGPNHIIDISKVPADVYVTGELTSDPARTKTQFKYIIELGHTSSEKPLFKWIKNQLLNRWRNVQIDLADRDMDIWGDDNYKNKMDRQAKADAEWEERRKNQKFEPMNYRDFDDFPSGWTEDDYAGGPYMMGIDESHPLIQYLMDNNVDGWDIEGIADYLGYYYEHKDEDARSQIIGQLLAHLGDIDPAFESEVSQNIEFYFPEYE